MMSKITISKFQLFFFLIQCPVGIGLLSLPNVVQSNAKGDGWISTIVAGVIVQLALIIYWFLFKQFPNKTYPEITKKIFGKYIGKLCNIIIYLYFLLTGGLALILFIKCVNLWLLPFTPMWVLSLVIVLASIYLTISDLRIIARFFVLSTFLFIFLIFLSCFTYSLPKEIQFILPVGDSGIKNILLGSNKCLISMLGFEGFLFIFPFVLNKEKGVLKTLSFANLTVTSLYTYFLFICLITFSPNQIKQVREPVLYLFRALTYEMLDRLDFIFLSIWIVPMTTSIIAYLFFSTKTISNEKSYKKLVVINGILIFAISLFPTSEKMIGLFSQYITYLSYVVVFGIPVILLCLSLLINKLGMSERS